MGGRAARARCLTRLLRVLASSPSLCERMLYADIFATIDLDGSGRINPSELRQALARGGTFVSEREAGRLLDEVAALVAMTTCGASRSRV